MSFSFTSIPLVKQLLDKKQANTITPSEQALLSLMQQKYDAVKDIANQQTEMVTNIASLEIKKENGTATEQELATLENLKASLLTLKNKLTSSHDQVTYSILEAIRKEQVNKRIQDLNALVKNTPGTTTVLNPDNYRDFLLASIGVNPYQRDTAANDVFRDMLKVISADMGVAKDKLTKQVKDVAKKATT